MIKVLFLMRDLRLNGEGKMTLSLVGRLNREIFTPVVVALNSSGPLKASIPSDITLINLCGRQGNAFQFPLKVYKYSSQLHKIINDVKPELVISDNWFAGILGASVIKHIHGIGAKLIIEFHQSVEGFKAFTSLFSMLSYIKVKITSFLFDKADVLVAVSETMRNDIIDTFSLNCNKVTVIYNGVDYNEIYKHSSKSGVTYGDFPYIIAIGRLAKEKGHELLLRSYALVVKDIPHKLVVVGEGGLSCSLESLARKLGLEKKIVFTGGLLNPYPLLKYADFLVLPSLWESFSYVLLEALALEVPIISTVSDGPTEILDHGKYGTLVPAGDEAALAEAIRRYALNPEERTRFATHSRARAECFSVDRMVREYEELFISLCS